MSEDPGTAGTTRREVLTKAVFVAPSILTLTAVASFASAGSNSHSDDHGKPDDLENRGKRGKPPKYGNFGD